MINQQQRDRMAAQFAHWVHVEKLVKAKLPGYTAPATPTEAATRMVSGEQFRDALTGELIYYRQFGRNWFKIGNSPLKNWSYCREWLPA